MFGRTPKVVIEKLDVVMDRILLEMSENGPDTPEYPELMSHLERITNLRKSEDKRKLSPDNLILVAGNLLGILIIVSYEHLHPMTSKALGFVQKP